MALFWNAGITMPNSVLCVDGTDAVNVTSSHTVCGITDKEVKGYAAQAWLPGRELGDHAAGQFR